MNGSILLVDDDGALLRALPETLRLRLPSLQVSTASSAAEARSLAAATDYDAIVTDIKMPGTDGLELLDALRRIRPDTPTLLITGHGDRDLAVRALRGGAYDFIQKPIDRDYIVASLERAIQSRRLTRKVEEQRRALARHARVVGQMSEGVFVVGADGRVELWNDAAATITWVPAASAVGRPIGEIFPGWEETADEIEVADANAVGVSAPPSLQTDGGKLRQVLTNLIENAVKYTREHGEVTVGVEPRETSLRFYVRDHGPGIALEEQRRIFDKFYRADPRLNNGVGGSGLGLYVSRELARRLEGRLSVHSTLGQGATFFLDLPLELQRAGRAPLGSAAS